MRVAEIRAAGDAFARAFQAKRDAKRLIDIGYATAAEPHAKTMRRALKTLGEAIEACVVQRALEILDLYDSDPSGYPDGRTAATALAEARKVCKSLYRRGKCARCKGHALRCAKRHARGMSCA